MAFSSQSLTDLQLDESCNIMFTYFKNVGFPNSSSNLLERLDSRSILFSYADTILKIRFTFLGSGYLQKVSHLSNGCLTILKLTAVFSKFLKHFSVESSNHRDMSYLTFWSFSTLNLSRVQPYMLLSYPLAGLTWALLKSHKSFHLKAEVCESWPGSLSPL